MLGGSLLGQKKYAEAESLLLAGYEGMKQRADKIPAIGKPRVKESLQRLVQLYEATGQAEKAADWNKKLAEFDRLSVPIGASKDPEQERHSGAASFSRCRGAERRPVVEPSRKAFSYSDRPAYRNCGLAKRFAAG